MDPEFREFVVVRLKAMNPAVLKSEQHLEAALDHLAAIRRGIGWLVLMLVTIPCFLIVLGLIILVFKVGMNAP